MCSIGGWYSWGKRRPDPEVIQGILLAGRTRGTDAAGVAWQNPDGVIMVSKARGDAKDFVKEIGPQKWAEIAKSPIGLLHNRAKTKGTEWKKENNHPVAGFGWVVVHNGTIRNDDDVFEYHKQERPAEVDTISINMLLSRKTDYLESFQELTVLEGGCTAAMWKVAEPDKLGLIRLGPNELYLWDEDGILYWSSAPSSGQWLPFRNLGSLAFQNTAYMPEDRLLVLTPEKARTFALTRNPFTPPAKPKPKVIAATPPTTGSVTTKLLTVGNPSMMTKPIQRGDLSKGPAYRWECLMAVTVGKAGMVKPPPIMENVVPAWNNIIAHFAKTRAEGHDQLLTAYGHWQFHSEKVQIGEGTSTVCRRLFHPAKRQKPFFQALFGSAYPELPAKKDSVGDTDFDLKLPLEGFLLRIPLEAGGELHVPGYMCPMCGVIEKATEWDNGGMRCRFCNVKFFLPLAKR